MGDNLDMCGSDVRVGFDEVGSEDASKQLWWVYRILFGGYVDCVLDGVGSYNDTVICLGISVVSMLVKSMEVKHRYDERGLNCSLEKHTDCSFGHSLHPSRGISLYFVDTNIVLSIASCSN